MATLGCGVYLVENNSCLRLIEPVQEIASIERPILLSDKILAKKWDREVILFDPEGPYILDRLVKDKKKGRSFNLESQIYNIHQGPNNYYIIQCQEQIYKLEQNFMKKLKLGGYKNEKVFFS